MGPLENVDNMVLLVSLQSASTGNVVAEILKHTPNNRSFEAAMWNLAIAGPQLQIIFFNN